MSHKRKLYHFSSPEVEEHPSVNSSVLITLFSSTLEYQMSTQLLKVILIFSFEDNNHLIIFIVYIWALSTAIEKKFQLANRTLVQLETNSEPIKSRKK